MTASVRLTISDDRVLMALEMIARAEGMTVGNWINLNLSMFSHRLEDAAETFLREPDKWDVSLQVALTPKPEQPRIPVIAGIAKH